MKWRDDRGNIIRAQPQKDLQISTEERRQLGREMSSRYLPTWLVVLLTLLVIVLLLLTFWAGRTGHGALAWILTAVAISLMIWHFLHLKTKLPRMAKAAYLATGRCPACAEELDESRDADGYQNCRVCGAAWHAPSDSSTFAAS